MNEKYIQKGDYEVGDRVRITYVDCDYYGRIGRIIKIERLRISSRGENAVRIVVKLPNENKIYLFGESASIVKRREVREKVIFT